MGIRTHVSRNPAMVLGGLKQGVTPLEMAKSYETLAQKGNVVTGSLAPYDGGPVTFTRVEGGNIDDKNKVKHKRAIPENIAEQATQILSTVVTSGTGRAAQIGEFAAGKTGTTENYQDAWFVGFDDDLTVAVWVGYPEGAKPMETEYRGEPVAGGTFPAEIWHDFMVSANKIRAARDPKAKRERPDRPVRSGSPRRPSSPARPRAAFAREVEAQEGAVQGEEPPDNGTPEAAPAEPVPEPAAHSDAHAGSPAPGRWRRQRRIRRVRRSGGANSGEP